MHSIDFHAAQVAPDVAYRSINPGAQIEFSFIAKTPGVFIYHCGTPPVLQHMQQLVAKTLQFEWAATRMVSDDPAKGLGRAKPEELFPQRLEKVIGEPTSELELVSAYFVPTDAGVKSFVGLAQSGVKVKVLTNALEATDVPAVHAGYAKHRKELLKAGVQLYELGRVSATDIGGKHVGIWGSSGSSLHVNARRATRSTAFP